MPSCLRLQPRTTSPNVWNAAERSCSKTTMPRCLTCLGYGVAHADPALGEAPNRLTNDADHRMYDYKLRHAVHLIDAISHVYTDDFEISDRIFDALRCSTKAAISLSRTWRCRSNPWSPRRLARSWSSFGAYRQLSRLLETRVHPDDLEAYTNDIDQIYDGSKHRHVMQYCVRNAAGDYILGRARRHRATEMSPALCRRARQPLLAEHQSTPPRVSERSTR